MRDVSLPPQDEVADIIKEAAIRRPEDAVALARMACERMLEFEDDFVLMQLVVELRLHSPEARRLRPILNGLRSSAVEWTEPDDPEIRHHGIKFELKLPEIKPANIVIEELLGKNAADKLMGHWTRRSVDFSQDAPIVSTGILVLNSQSPSRARQERFLQRAGCEGTASVMQAVLFCSAAVAKAEIAGVPLCWRASDWDKAPYISAGAIDENEFALLVALRHCGVRVQPGTLGINDRYGSLDRYDCYMGDDSNPESLAFGATIPSV